MERLLKAPRSLLVATALLMMFAIPAMAQNGSITMFVECETEPEGLIITNDTDEDIVVMGITSSFEADGDPERDLNVTVASGDYEYIYIGEEVRGGGDNIFNNEESESAKVYVAGQTFTVGCDAGPVAFDPGGERRPEPTGQVPGGMGKSGAGGLAGGASVPLGMMGLAASSLLAAGYAVLRCR